MMRMRDLNMGVSLRAAVCGCVGVLGVGELALGQVWRELGPAPISGLEYTGRVSAIVASPTDPNRYFAAGADGGVWRTGDGGATWTPLTDGMPTLAMGALAMDPADENVIYAGSGEANFANHSRYGLGVYKSVDGGDTWAQLAEGTFAGRCFSKIVIDPVDTQVLYAGVTRAGGFPEMAAAKGHPQREGPVGVFKSVDGGVTWAHLGGGLPALGATDLVIDPMAPATLYAAIGHIFGSSENGVYKSVDGGATWVKLGGGLPAGVVGRISIGIAPSNPQRLYALITRPADASGGGATTLGAWRTSDGGATWTSLPVPSIQSTYGWYLSMVSVQPTNPDLVFMGGLSLVGSANAGASWSTVTPPHVDLHGAAWDAAGRFLVADDGGVHRTANLGASWTSHNTKMGVIQFYAGFSLHPGDETVMIGGTQDNGTNRRGGAAGAWQRVAGGDGGWTQINQSNPLIVFAESQGTGNLLRSVNGGLSFGGSSSGINGGDRNCFLPPYLIDPVNPSRMLYATHRMYESVNGGVGWVPVSGDLTGGAPAAVRSLAMSASDPSVVYASTNDGRVLVSTDGARNFVLIAQGVAGWPRVMRQMVVHPTQPGRMYLAVSGFGEDGVRRTTDFGETWVALGGTGSGLPDVPVNTVAVDVSGGGVGGGVVVYAGTDDGVYRSLDDGVTWARFGCGLARGAVIDVVVDVPRERVVIATQGRGAWEAPLRWAADWNGDHRVNSGDISGFLMAWIAGVGGGGLEADFNGDGTVNSADVSAFLTAWLEAVGPGC